MGFLATMLNGIIALFGGAAGFLLQLLPNSPFTWNLDGTSTALTWIQWLFPISGFVTSIGTYVAAVALYYVIRVALRWVKVVGS